MPVPIYPISSFFSFSFPKRGSGAGGGGEKEVEHTSAALAAARRASSVAGLLLRRDDICGGTDARGFLGGVDGAEAGAGAGTEPRVLPGRAKGWVDDDDPCSLEDLPQRLPMLLFLLFVLSLLRLVWLGREKNK